MSGLSLMTMRPFVVSITIALFLSRPAGSDWAIAGAAQMSAARKARTRIMKTPDQMRKKPGRKRGSTGEFGLEGFGNLRRHKCRDVAAHAGDLAYQCGSDRANGRRGRDEDRVHLGGHGLVHARDLHLVVEVGTVAQATDHDDRAGLLRGRHREVVVGRGVKRATGLG